MSLYEDAGGFDGLLALCRRWHVLCLADPVAEHPFSPSRGDIHPQHDERLAAYLAEALGGPKLYTGGYGDESSMQRIHAGHGVHEELDEACLAQFDQALTDVGIVGEAGERIMSYFRDSTAAMRAYSDNEDQVPEFLPFNYAP
jgi:hemoglobin